MAVNVELTDRQAHALVFVLGDLMSANKNALLNVLWTGSEDDVKDLAEVRKKVGDILNERLQKLLAGL